MHDGHWLTRNQFRRHAVAPVQHWMQRWRQPESSLIRWQVFTSAPALLRPTTGIGGRPGHGNLGRRLRHCPTSDPTGTPTAKHLFTVPMCRLVCPMQHSRLDHPHLPGLPVIMAQGHDHSTGQDPPPTVSKTGFFRSIAWKRLRGTFSESSTSDGSRFDEARSTVLYSLPFLLCLPPCLSFPAFRPR